MRMSCIFVFFPTLISDIVQQEQNALIVFGLSQKNAFKNQTGFVLKLLCCASFPARYKPNS
jgi:hypothetical protein